MQILCPRNQAYRSRLGFLGPLLSTAASAYAAKEGAGGGASPGVARPTMPQNGGSTTVSPTIQTQISPQISPVFQQTGSGDQAATTTMVSPGGQTAIPSPPTPSPPGSTYGNPTPNVYADPYARDFDIRRYVPPGSSATEQITAMKGQQWLWPAALVASAAIAALAFMPARKKAS